MGRGHMDAQPCGQVGSRPTPPCQGLMVKGIPGSGTEPAGEEMIEAVSTICVAQRGCM